MDILIWGGRSKTRIMLRMLEELYGDRARVTGIFDRTLAELPFSAGVPLYSTPADLRGLIGDSSHYLVCIGGEHGYARTMVGRTLQDRGLKPVAMISRHAILDDLESCGVGLQAMPGAVIHKFCRVGDHCIVNTNATVDHECTVGDGVHVMGGASIAGRVSIGPYSTIGTNATVLPNVTIGKNVYVGAGAVVTKDVGDGVVVTGVPARRLRDFTPLLDLSAFDWREGASGTNQEE